MTLTIVWSEMGTNAGPDVKYLLHLFILVLFFYFYNFYVGLNLSVFRCANKVKFYWLWFVIVYV